MSDKTLSFTQRLLAEALDNVRCLSDLGPELIAAQVFAASAQQPAQAVPDGWKLVPFHATREQVNAVFMHPDLARTLYRNMVEAAPAAPVAQKPVAFAVVAGGRVQYLSVYQPPAETYAAAWNAGGMNDAAEIVPLGRMGQPSAEQHTPAVPETFNEWFLAQPEGRQAVLREDRWMLADAAYAAGKLAAAPAAPVALGIDGCGKPLCGGIEFAGGHHPLCQHHAAPAAPEPAPPAQDPGLYAIHYRDNWDGEGDTYYLVAQRAEDGRWLNYESGRELLEYEGDAVLEVWPLTSGTTSDKYRAELYDEVWEKARAMGYGNVTMALAELERLKAAEQPDTVMLAEALKPFADAFEATGLPQYRGADDEHAEFLDENQITPVRGITMRQFRRAWEVLSGKSALLGKEGEA